MYALFNQPGVVVHTLIPAFKRRQKQEDQVQDQHWLYSDFEVNMDYLRSCL